MRLMNQIGFFGLNTFNISQRLIQSGMCRMLTIQTQGIDHQQIQSFQLTELRFGNHLEICQISHTSDPITDDWQPTVHQTDRYNIYPGSLKWLKRDGMHFNIRNSRILMLGKYIWNTRLYSIGYILFCIDMNFSIAAKRT